MVAPFEQRTKGSRDKVMFVTMSRRIAVELHDESVLLRPEWYHKKIAHELVESVRGNISIDRQLKESVQAHIRRHIKRILRLYRYPPDDPATGDYTVSVNKVITQAGLLPDAWSRE